MRGMDLEAFRTSRGLTQEQLAKALGLRSKSYISRLETGLGPPASLRLALKIERFSEGLVRARDLVAPDEAELLPPCAPQARA